MPSAALLPLGFTPNTGLDGAAAAADNFRGVAAIEQLDDAQSAALDSARSAADRFLSAAEASFPTTREEPSSGVAFACLAGAGVSLALLLLRGRSAR